VGVVAEALRLRGFTDYEQALAAIFGGLLGAVLFGVVAALADRGTSSGAVAISLEEHDLILHQRSRVRVIPRDRVVGGIVLHEQGQAVLEIHLRGDRVIRAGMRDPARAEELVALLGVDRRRAAVTLGGQGRALAVAGVSAPLAFLTWASLMSALHLDSPLAPPLMALLVVASTLLVRRALLPRQVVVGDDGVHVGGRFRDRFVRLAEIGRAVQVGRDLVLEPRPGADPRPHAAITVPCPDPGVAAGLADRVRAALERAPGRARSAGMEALLDPGDQPLGAWRIAMGRALRGEGRYRSAPVTPEDLRAVLDDAAAPRRLRVGAALALRDAGDPDAQERAGRAAEACADEGTRAALEAAAEDEVNERVVGKRLRA
jgi:hypothetical protein